MKLSLSSTSCEGGGARLKRGGADCGQFRARTRSGSALEWGKRSAGAGPEEGSAASRSGADAKAPRGRHRDGRTGGAAQGGRVASHTTMQPDAFRKYALVIEWKRSWPAVSHTCTLTTSPASPSTSAGARTFFVQKSTPIVDSLSLLNVPAWNARIRNDLPAPESPTRMSLNIMRARTPSNEDEDEDDEEDDNEDDMPERRAAFISTLYVDCS